MKITNKMLDDLQDAIISLQGINMAHNSYVLAEEGNGELFIKFMSDGGVTDDENGSVLNKFLAQKVGLSQYEYFDGRKFIANYAVLASAFGLEVCNG